MSFRGFAETCAATSALALALTLATPAAAADGAGELSGDPPSYPAAPDMRPEWRGGSHSSAMQPDGRARDAWLRECRRRTAMYYDYDGYSHHRRHDRHDRHDRQRDSGYEGGYDYCEAYFDDYYRTYTQPGYGYGYAYPQMGYVLPVPMMMQQQVYQTRQPVEEVVTEEYVPMRSRIIERRPARRILQDKRIRVAP